MELLKSFAHSKRAQGVLASILVWALGTKIGLDEATADRIAGAILVLVAAFAAGDLGKEAAKIKEAA